MRKNREAIRHRECVQQASAEICTAALAEPDSLLDLVAHKGRLLAAADACFIALHPPKGALEIEYVATPFTGVPRARQWIGCRLEDVLAEQELSLVPLKAREREFGVLGLLWSDGPPTPFAQVQAGISTFASQVAQILTLVEARAEQQRREVLEDRDRIARDLHDLVIQRLFAAGLMLAGIPRRNQLPEDAACSIEAILDELDGTAREIRRTIFALHGPPAGSSPNGVRNRILREAQQFGASVQFAGNIDEVGEAADDMLAAIREALANSAKHAQASRIELAIEVDEIWLTVSVTDDGIGIAQDGPGRRSGLANLAARASSRGGECSVSGAEKAGGTRLLWRVPLG